MLRREFFTDKEGRIMPAPKDRLLATLNAFEEMIAIERMAPRRLKKDIESGRLAVIFEEQGGDESLLMSADALSGVLTLAENVARVRPELGLDAFWAHAERDEAFADLHTQLAVNPLYLVTLKAHLEDIFSVPLAERVYEGHKRELLSMLTDEPEAVVSEPTLHQPQVAVYNRRRMRRLVALGTLSAVGIAACAVMEGPDTDTTLTPLVSLAPTLPASTEATVSETTVVTATTPPTVVTSTTIFAPETTLAPSTVPETTLAPPETTAPVSTLPPETVPPATEPPATPAPLPPETAPATTAVRPNDGVLSPEACRAESGSGVRFNVGGPTLWEYMQERYSITPGQVSYLLNHTDFLDRYHVRDIYGSTEDRVHLECMPYIGVVQHYLESYSGA
jgi:hypothetical protein